MVVTTDLNPIILFDPSLSNNSRSLAVRNEKNAFLSGNRLPKAKIQPHNAL
jgi:hypothetical protein